MFTCKQIVKKYLANYSSISYWAGFIVFYVIIFHMAVCSFNFTMLLFRYFAACKDPMELTFFYQVYGLSLVLSYINFMFVYILII